MKPDDIPQDIWEAAYKAANAKFDPYTRAYVADIASAILAAEKRGEERGAHIIEANMLCSDREGLEVLRPRGTSGNKVGLAYAAAIRKRGEPT